ncbi:hypothetical protein [Hymenobacter cavernae]|uniref:Grasp-with-spasm system SPASM domain peptide maturase n=1 Tax=Hymenobacter cavernae TaxID=2044852 RepID=A0ABQ1TXA0_9BACT|nr:hypothetical protein [Hymenobacter cavernae]GGF03783.1 hypothetical protein GCM10011383_13550 [Hymenobacter cavernae]
MSSKPYFCLYAHDIAVQGATRSAIYDLQHQHITFIPNVLYKVLLHLKQHPWRETQQVFAPGNPQLFDQYLHFLLQKDLGFYIDAPASFPPLSLAWHSPHHVQNAVVSYAFAHYSLPDVLAQLDALHCRHLELRLNLGCRGAWPEVVALFQQLETMVFSSVTLLLAYSENVPDEPQLGAFYEQFAKIQHILVHRAPYSRPGGTHPGQIAFTERDLCADQPKDCYIVNSEFFTEALQFNPYYNRKVCVSAEGYVKNCLLRPEHFANVRDTRLATVLARPDFQELWHAAPDQTAGLQASELRYALFSAAYLVRDSASGLFTREPQLTAAEPRLLAAVA